jgi:hypothetical protein
MLSLTQLRRLDRTGGLRDRLTLAQIGSRWKRHGRLGRRDPEAEALLQVQVDGVRVVVLVSDRKVLAAVEEEIAPPHAYNGAAVDRGRPHDRAAEDLAQVLEQGIPTVLAGLEDPGVNLRAEREAVVALDTGRAERVDGFGDVRRGVGTARSPRPGLSPRGATPRSRRRCRRRSSHGTRRSSPRERSGGPPRPARPARCPRRRGRRPRAPYGGR